jgi:hypothetical protein
MEAGEISRQAAAFLQRPHDRPFFLSCGFFLTHRTGAGVQWHNDDASPLGDPRYVRVPAPLPDTPEIRCDFADFAVAASRLDAAMGTVLDALDQAGFVGGKVVDALVSHVDLFPTICEVAGLTPPPWLQGVPLSQQRDEVFSEVNWHAALEPMRSVRTTRYKYIRRYASRPGPVLPNCDDSVSKNEFRTAGWDKQPLPPETLYDLVLDPNESCNLAGDPQCAAVLKEMRARLDRWMRETHDPLLSGILEPWPGMVVNPVDDESAEGLTIPATASIINNLYKQ